MTRWGGALRIAALVRRHPLASFILLTFGLSWAYWASATPASEGMPAMLVSTLVKVGGGLILLRNPIHDRTLRSHREG